MNLVFTCTLIDGEKIELDLIRDRKSLGKLIPTIKERHPQQMKIEFRFNGRPAFTYHIKDLRHLREIVPFISFSCSTTAYNCPPSSVGFYDRQKGLRIEFFNGQFLIYPNVRTSKAKKVEALASKIKKKVKKVRSISVLEGYLLKVEVDGELTKQVVSEVEEIISEISGEDNFPLVSVAEWVSKPSS
jgi:hypothetical protein